ncbi:MAG TPA: glycosyltransferase family 4 protein [Gallionella sp.]|nr:glycosyltransferase family 4 protein [Gallionella sp.]
MINLLFVHQSADLYGSDKMLLSLVKGIDKQRFHAIVLLPVEGELLTALHNAGIEAHVVPLLRLGRASMSVSGLLNLFLGVVPSLRAMNRVLQGRKVSIVHSNTLAVLSGALWARWRGLPHVWHVHEMVEQPRIARHLFPWLLRLFADAVACNSYATRRWLLDVQPDMVQRSKTIWNGVDRTVPLDLEAAQDLRHRLNLAPDTVLLLLMGRINRGKGHQLMVQAAERLQQMGVTQVHYLIAGSAPPGQEHLLTELQQRITASAIADKITVINFQQNIWSIWDAADIALVPSTLPEAFGMVAVEAMLANKPVIASAQGGLLDIVEDGVTGLLCPVNDVDAWAAAMHSLVCNMSQRKQMGQAGQVRALRHFALREYVNKFEQLYWDISEQNT